MLADDNDLDILCEGIEDLGNRYIYILLLLLLISSVCQLSLNVEVEQVKKKLLQVYYIYIVSV